MTWTQVSYKPFSQQQAQFPQQTVEQQTNAHHAGHERDVGDGPGYTNRRESIGRIQISGEGQRKHDDQACFHDAAPLFGKS